MPLSFSAGVRDSLSNLAASLGVGRDKAVYDAFGLRTLERAQIESMYRGDWLARKVVDIVPYDSIRAWRAWSGHRADVDRMEAAERRLGLRKILQRAMVLGRLYGGGAILIGTGETDPAALARPLDERLPRGGLVFLHVVSRWQLGVAALDNDPLSPWCGEPALYELSAPARPALALHPSRVVRFLGHPLPDPTLAPSFWSDSVLQVLYDAIHAVALTTAGATSLMHEAKVDIVTVPNLSEHLSSTETTQQLSARFAYAAAMKSINNLLLLGDGETWSRQSVDFGGLPEMVRTFLQVAAGAADIPVTRLLGQSPAGLSATGDSDTRNYYDMIAARQELDLRPQLERLDRLIARSEGLDPGALTFAFRPLWQLDTPSQAALALKAQATQIYAGLKLWPAEVTARLVEAQLVADGTYPNAAALFGEGRAPDVEDRRTVVDFDAEQKRDWRGRWTTGASGAGRAAEPESSAGAAKAATTAASTEPPSPGVQTQGSPGPANLTHQSLEKQLTAILGPPETDPEAVHRFLQEHLVKAQVALPLPLIAALAGAAAVMVHRALQTALEGAAHALRSLFQSTPPQPGPKGSGPPPSTSPEDPRPLTIHGPRGSSSPPGLDPAGSVPTSPPGREPEASLPPLPPSRAAELFGRKPAAGAPPTSSDPNPTPGYVFSEKINDPTKEAANVPAADPSASKALAGEPGSNGPLRSPAPSVPAAPAPGAIAFNPDGSFSITDWTGYPEGVPKPPGPFRLRQGDDYKAARKEADRSNGNLHRSNPPWKDLEIHEIHPIKFGGAPDSPENKVALEKSDHWPFNAWWLRLQRFLERGE